MPKGLILYKLTSPKGLARCRTPLGSMKMSAQLTLRPTVG